MDSKEYVLIVEDSDTFRKVIVNLVEKYTPFETIITSSYKETKELLTSKNLNIFAVLSDIHLPDANNGEVIDLLIAKNLSVVALTSDVSEELRKNLNAKPIVDYLLKRSPEDIKDAVEFLNKLKRNQELKVLIVDDSKISREHLKTLLKPHKLILLEADNGIDGLQRLDENQDISLIFIDYEMPGMNGHEFTQKVRRKFSKEDMAILAVSSDGSSISKFLKYGANDFIKKPFSKEELYSRSYTNIDNLKMTQRAKEAEKLAEAEENLLRQYRTAIDGASVVSKANTKGIITYVNEALCTVSKYSREELIGKNHNIVRHPDMPKDVFKDLWETITSKKPWYGIIKNRAKDGSHYWMDSSIFPLLDKNEEIMEFISIRHDVTQFQDYRESLEKNLNLKEKDFGEVLRVSKAYENGINESNILSRADLKGKITYVNDEFCRVSGYRREEVIGKNHNIVRHPDNPRELFKDLWETITTGKVWKKTIKNRAKDGSDYYVNTTILPITDENGNVLEYMGIRHNVTEIIELKNEIEESQREITYRIGEVAETRSKETGNHIKRVAEYCKLLAELSNLSEREIELIYYASPLHDVGKVAIPDSVLKKPGKLDENEWKTMKSHSKIGYEVFKDSKRDILQTAAIVSHEHHEKWNGTGYPRGLKGGGIHVFGRITAVADVFDALGSNRCYKKAWELDKIIDLFKEEKGQHFDPALVDLFLDNLDRFLEIRDKFVDC
ncbi:MAG: PAS domain S-box protein [Nitrospinae bacterium]|nr:PAS domain S-box protein [Nitrospinota bacterium]